LTESPFAASQELTAVSAPLELASPTRRGLRAIKPVYLVLIAIVLALFLGRDPSITAARRAATAGEVVTETPRPAMAVE